MILLDTSLPRIWSPPEQQLTMVRRKWLTRCLWAPRLPVLPWHHLCSPRKWSYFVFRLGCWLQTPVMVESSFVFLAFVFFAFRQERPQVILFVTLIGSSVARWYPLSGRPDHAWDLPSVQEDPTAASHSLLGRGKTIICHNKLLIVQRQDC